MVNVSFRQRVTFDVHDTPSDYAHMVTLTSVTWGATPLEDVFVDKRLPRVDDAKPINQLSF